MNATQPLTPWKYKDVHIDLGEISVPGDGTAFFPYRFEKVAHQVDPIILETVQEMALEGWEPDESPTLGAIASQGRADLKGRFLRTSSTLLGVTLRFRRAVAP